MNPRAGGRMFHKEGLKFLIGKGRENKNGNGIGKIQSLEFEKKP